MTKFRIAIVAALALLLLGLPPLFGLLAENQLRHYATADGQMDVAIDEYERGWFSSRGRLSVSPSSADQGDALWAQIVEPIQLAVQVNHGPLSFKHGIFLGLSEMHIRRVDAGAATGGVDFEIELHSTFGGDVNFLAQFLPFQQSGELGVLSFSGGRVDGTITRQRIDARTEFDSLQVDWQRGYVDSLRHHTRCRGRVANRRGQGLPRCRLGNSNQENRRPSETAEFHVS